MQLEIPAIPDNAPFSAEQRSWLNGFIAGLLSRGAVPVPGSASAGEKVLILFGSQSGNAEALAKKAGKTALARGLQSRVASMDAIDPLEVANERNLLIITSTWGEGDMPDNAAGFWSGLNQNGSSPKLGGLRFSVLALGDRNYTDTFCLAGRRFDERLAALGAERLTPCVECDVDYDTPASSWMEEIFSKLAGGGTATPAITALAIVAPEIEEEGWSKKRPYPAVLLRSENLNAPGSAKETRHVEFSLGDSGLLYEAGDALGVYPVNCPEVVDGVISATGFSPGAKVPLPDGSEDTLRNALMHHYEIRALAGQVPDQTASAAELIGNLRRLQPRLYSISSSPNAHPGEVHLTVGAVRYTSGGIAHKGVASTFLADRLAGGDTAGVFVHRSPGFRLPLDAGVPVIMVGPGTGIAPFRAFLEEREAGGAAGRNWLFFGDQRSSTDFLYQDQIRRWQRSGILTRLDTAFSRDQTEKIYVQHRMLENAAELYAWLEEGAFFYVCGDASRMAKDVNAALHKVFETGGKMSADVAAVRVAGLRSAKRYLRDVY